MDMYQTIILAMQALAHDGQYFGATNSQKGEDEFQRRLGEKLEDCTRRDGWSWRYISNKEERFSTAALRNKDEIKIDIVGRHRTSEMVAVELKYVMVKDEKKPSNTPAFSWDVAKDCLRLDLLRAGLCRPISDSDALPIPKDLQTYVIGMTDWSGYWSKHRTSGGWAANFIEATRMNPVRFEGVIHTKGSNPEKTIFRAGRCHIAFGLPWAGEWRLYSERFRYLILRPASDAEPKWTHHEKRSIEEQSAIYPFMNKASRDEHARHYEQMLRPERVSA